ncbi:hypothetical protein BpHYR1_018318 [Brachionus plicatilis]|uniref:Uncharacterized protein n=1 Tax=Brachionus plicatilis TaxID=10195 RepID=A0A3M7QLJ5_BRAPC|nr:hypothetical protein BpHYR1_018318 [Brachionus plicatilis]
MHMGVFILVQSTFCFNFFKFLKKLKSKKLNLKNGFGPSIIVRRSLIGCKKSIKQTFKSGSICGEFIKNEKGVKLHIGFFDHEICDH